MEWTSTQLPSLTGRRAIVTGANSGIGLVTASELARVGASVVLACRNPELGTQAGDRIRTRTPGADVEFARLDLASLASVRDFAAAIDGPVDLLINNAGVMTPPRRVETVDGFELQFGTNHLGHFALTGLLLPQLLQGDAARVVTVSSIAHYHGGADVVEGNAGPKYSPMHTYANSKLANLLFALELQRRAAAHGLALTSTAAHPGVSATNLFSSKQGVGSIPGVGAVTFRLTKLAAQSAQAGANPTLYAATVAEPGSFTGPQRLRQSRGPIGPARLSRLDRDETLAGRLWEVSEELTELHFPWP